MGKLGKKYKMLIGEPCRCYYKNNADKYSFQGVGYYIGNGYCVMHDFTTLRDNLLQGIEPYIIKYDRYIPTRLWNKNYGSRIKVNEPFCRYIIDDKRLNTPDYDIDDFNTDALEDWYYGHLDEFWWWHEIRKKVTELRFKKTFSFI